MLVDDVTITVKAGDGGNGSVHFRRNAQTARGGPDGGNGGNGGNVYFQGIDDILGLQEFRFRKHLEAEAGIKGAGKKLFGRNGHDLVLRIPLGTLVTNTQTQEQFEIRDTETKILVAKGGIGGRGNDEFKSATLQAPKFAEPGTPGEQKELHLELRLIADIGFIGLPNAGKSSLLKTLTNANPKIGNYPFTTLEPNIGMMKGITLADIPGLIEGASEGKGLGTQFLRHVEKTKLLVHCIDITQDNILETYQTVRHELQEYKKEIITKPEIILLTKTDLLPVEDVAEKVKQAEKTLGKSVHTVSVIDDVKLHALEMLLVEMVKK